MRAGVDAKGYQAVETKEDPSPPHPPQADGSGEDSAKLWIVATERPELKRWIWRAKVALLAGCVILISTWATVANRTTSHADHNTNDQHFIALGRQRWAIAGLGRIAYDFAAALESHGGRLQAVAAGSLPESHARASAFAQTFGVQRHYGSYEELAADDSVDVVYIATTNHLHRPLALLFLRAGKHVLVEKPTALNAAEALEMLREARQRGLLLVTNFWNMAFPATRWAMDDIIAANKIGEVLAVRGDMAFEAVYDLQDRFLSPKLGGGAVLDMGCYIVHLFIQVVARSFEQPTQTLPTRASAAYAFTVDSLAEPFQAQLDDNAPLKPLNTVRVEATGHLNMYRDASAGLDDPGQTPVDVEVSAAVEFAGIRLLLGTSLQRASPFSFEVLGAHGLVRLESPANCPESATAQVYRDANSPNQHVVVPCCGQPLVEELEFRYALDPYPARYKPERYPNGMGFAYVATLVEKCLITASAQSSNCLELDQIPAWTQLATQQVVDEIIDQVKAAGDLF